MSLGGPCLDNLTNGFPGGLKASLRDSRADGGFGYDFFLLQRAVDFCLHDETILPFRGTYRQFGLTGFYFDSHKFNNLVNQLAKFILFRSVGL